MSYHLIRKRFQEVSDNDSDVIFSDDELRQLFSSVITPSLIVSLIIGLQNKKISPDQVIRSILQTGPADFHEKKLLIVGLALRYQGSLNQYVNDVQLSNDPFSTLNPPNFHLIPWICQNFPPDDHDMLYQLLKSANPDFDNSVAIKNSDTAETVSQWLQRYYPNSIFITSNNLPHNNTIAVLIDQPTRLTNQMGVSESVTVPELEQILIGAITSHSANILREISHLLEKIVATGELLEDTSSSYFHNSTFLDLSVKHLNNDAYTLLLDLGWIPTYSVLNNILIFMKYYNERNNTVACKLLSEILTTSLSKGYHIDNVQFEMLSSICPDDISNIVSSKPSSKSLSKPSSKSVDSFRKIALLLGIMSDNINQIKKEYSLRSTTSIITSIISYERKYIETATIESDMIPIRTSINSFQRNIMSSVSTGNDIDGDVDLFCIVDKDRIKWPIMPYALEIIRTTRTNPMTGESLETDQFHRSMKQRNTIKRLGYHTEMSLNGNNIYNTSGGIKSSKTRVTDDFTKKIVDSFKRLSLLYGLDPRDIEYLHLKIKYIDKILSELSKHFPSIPTELHHLDDNNINITFIRICMMVIRQNPSFTNSIFTMIKLAISRKSSPTQ